MLNRALIQPDPAIYLGMVADMMQAAAAAAVAATTCSSGSRTPASCCASTARSRRRWPRRPPSARWELEQLRTIENVVRLGHIRHGAARPARPRRRDRSRVADDALVVNCAADGLKNPPLVPIWGPEAITLQPIRAGFPCFGAALAGYVEATRDDDAEKNRLCPPSSFGNTLTDWATDERPGHAERRRRSAPSPTSRSGPTGSRSTRRASRPSTAGRRRWTTRWGDCRPTWDRGWPGWPS